MAGGYVTHLPLAGGTFPLLSGLLFPPGREPVPAAQRLQVDSLPSTLPTLPQAAGKARRSGFLPGSAGTHRPTPRALEAEGVVERRGWGGEQAGVTEHARGAAHAQCSRQLPIAAQSGRWERRRQLQRRLRLLLTLPEVAGLDERPQ